MTQKYTMMKKDLMIQGDVMAQEGNIAIETDFGDEWHRGRQDTGLSPVSSYL